MSKKKIQFRAIKLPKKPLKVEFYYRGMKLEITDYLRKLAKKLTNNH